jgi:nicotinate-nucleotide adenylyltransferase
MRRIGVFGGTFDPVHLGHLAVAAEVRRAMNLADFIFMPAGQPYFKNLKNISDSQHRLNMLRLALQDKPFYSISQLELERPGPTYAVESMSKMKAGLKAGEELYFILGWDALMNLPKWREAARLIEICRIVAVPRPGFSQPDIAQIEKELTGIARRCTILERPLIDISSSAIRRRVAEGLPIAKMVPAAVEEYIHANSLYREDI